MPAPAVDPALVSAIVAQVLVALQGMSVSAATDVDQDELNSDADDVQSLPDGIDSSPIPASPTSPSQSLESTATTAAAAVADELMLAGEMPAATIEPDTPAGLPAMTPGAAGLGMEPTAVVQGPWYMISTGRAVGVYRGWHIASPFVVGVSGACYKKYSSEGTALAAFAEAQAAGVVTVVS